MGVWEFGSKGVWECGGVAVLPATWRDTLEVAALERACFQEDAWPVIDVFFALTGRGSLRLKAMAGDRLVGFLAASPDRRHGQAWITTLGVHPEFRGRGIGSALLRACEARIDAPRLKLTVRESNRPARSLYGKFGYLPVGVWQNYYRGGQGNCI